MKKIFILFILTSTHALAQNVNTYINKGNEYYLQLRFELAEAQYRQALEVAPANMEARYNLGNALMQQKKFKAAIEMYEGVVTSKSLRLRSAAYYNAGVSYSKQKDLVNSIEAYKNALRLNPDDMYARENLQKALYELKQQQQQNKQNNKGGGGMDQKQADQKLKELEQKEKELQRKIQNMPKGKGEGGGKDW